MKLTPHVPAHLSASSLAQFLRCGADYYFNRIEKIRLPASAPMNFGSAVHLAVRAYHLGEDPEAEFARQWRFLRKQMVAEGVAVSDHYTPLGLELLTLYTDRFPADEGTPEVAGMVRLAGVRVPIRYVFDLLLPNGRVRELKTSGWAWGVGRPAKELQGQLYRVLYPLVTGKSCVAIDYVILSANPSKLTTYTLPAEEGMAERLAKTCTVVLDAMAAGRFPPACPPSQCRYPGESFCPLLRATQERGSEAHSVEVDRAKTDVATLLALAKDLEVKHGV